MGKGCINRAASILGEEWRQGLLPPTSLSACRLPVHPCSAWCLPHPSCARCPQARGPGDGPSREESSSHLAKLDVRGGNVCASQERGWHLGLSLKAFTRPSVFTYHSYHQRYLVLGMSQFQAPQHDSCEVSVFPTLLSLARMPSVFQNVVDTSQLLSSLLSFPLSVYATFVLLLSCW